MHAFVDRGALSHVSFTESRFNLNPGDWDLSHLQALLDTLPFQFGGMLRGKIPDLLSTFSLLALLMDNKIVASSGEKTIQNSWL